LNKKPDRKPTKRHRDLRQAQCVAALVSARLPQLVFDGDELRMLPKASPSEGSRVMGGDAIKLRVGRARNLPRRDVFHLKADRSETARLADDARLSSFLALNRLQS
jgi:hypothetical protein